MKEDIRQFVRGMLVGVAVKLVVDILYAAASESFTIPDMFLLGGPYLWIVLPVIFALIFLVGGRLYRKKHESHVSFLSIPRRPEYAVTRLKATYFGVLWKVDIGTVSPFDDEPYPYAHRPLCPTCGYELDSKEEFSMFGWKKRYVWKCAPCDTNYDRPKDYLFEEDRVVEKIAMREFRKERS